MVNTTQPYAGDARTSPIVVCITSTIISCILAAGIIIQYAPKAPPTWGPVMWLVIAAALTVATVVLISRRKPFARKLFFKVAKWVFLYILVLTGVGEYVMVFDKLSGERLIVLTLVQVLFLINIPMLWGFSVARHERVSN